MSERINKAFQHWHSLPWTQEFTEEERLSKAFEAGWRAAQPSEESRLLQQVCVTYPPEAQEILANPKATKEQLEQAFAQRREIPHVEPRPLTPNAGKVFAGQDGGTLAELIANSLGAAEMLSGPVRDAVPVINKVLAAQPLTPNAGEVRLALEEAARVCESQPMKIRQKGFALARGQCAAAIRALAASTPGPMSPRPEGHEETSTETGWRCSCGWHGDNLFEHWKDARGWDYCATCKGIGRVALAASTPRTRADCFPATRGETSQKINGEWVPGAPDAPAASTPAGPKSGRPDGQTETLREERCPQCDENSRCGNEWHERQEAESDVCDCEDCKEKRAAPDKPQPPAPDARLSSSDTELVREYPSNVIVG